MIPDEEVCFMVSCNGVDRRGVCGAPLEITWGQIRSQLSNVEITPKTQYFQCQSKHDGTKHETVFMVHPDTITRAMRQEEK